MRSLLPGIGQAAFRQVLLGLGLVQLAVQRCPLLVQLAAALFRRGDRLAVFRRRSDGLLVVGRPLVGRLLFGGDLVGQFSGGGVGGLDGRFQLVELHPQGPQLAPPRDQSGGQVPRPDDQRAGGFEQLAGEGDVAQAGADGVGQCQGVVEFLDEPRPAQQPVGQRGEAGVGLHEAVRPAEHARTAFEVGAG